jgi:hypothetical protein
MNMEKVIGFLEENYQNVIATPTIAVWRTASGGSAAVQRNSYGMMVVRLNGQVKGIGNTPDYVINIIQGL